MLRDRVSKSRSVLQPPTRTSEEVPENDERLLDNTLAEGDSYQELKTASSGGAHFQFELEKLWNLADKPVNSKFLVKLVSLSENFSSIPFDERMRLYSEYYRRHCIGSLLAKRFTLRTSFFSDDDDDDAETLSELSDLGLLSETLDELDREWRNLDQSSGEAENKEIAVSKSNSSEEDKSNDVTSKLSQLSIIGENCNQEMEPTESNKHNLEDWLDSILDD